MVASLGNCAKQLNQNTDFFAEMVQIVDDLKNMLTIQIVNDFKYRWFKLKIVQLKRVHVLYGLMQSWSKEK